MPNTPMIFANLFGQVRRSLSQTVQKFPHILDEIALATGKTFAIIIDEAHSSQGGKTSAAMSKHWEI